MTLEIPSNYQLIHTQIANFDSLLENMITLEKKRGTSSRVNIKEVLEFKNIVKDRNDTALDAVPLDARFDYGTSYVNIATPDQHINLEIIYDLARFELDGLNRFGSKFLEKLTKETPITVYFFGTGSRAWGSKEMRLISPQGDYSILDPNTFMEKKWKLNDPIKSKVNYLSPLTQTIDNTITTYLKRNSTCNLFLHHFGNKLDVNDYYSHIKMPAEYISTKEQIENGIFIPPNQYANIDALLEMEKNTTRGKRGQFSDLYAYEHEGDKRAYYVFVGGEMYGFNNLRGIPGYLRNIQSNKPGKPILIHTPGTRLDFDFIEKLKLINFPSF